MTASDTTSTILSGIDVSPGPVTSPVARMAPPIPEPGIVTFEPSRDVEKECERIALTVQQVRKGLELSAAEAKTGAHMLLETTAQKAADPVLTSTAQAMVRERRLVSEHAVWESARTLASMLESLSGYVAKRTRDVQDARSRIVAVLIESPMSGIPRPPEPFVLVAADLTPTNTALLNPEKVIAFIASEDGSTSHTAILTRILGMPAIVGTGEEVTDALAEDDIVLVDGTKGSATLSSSEDTLCRTRESASRVRVFNDNEVTEDDHEVQLLANVGDATGARSAIEAEATDIGLFRTEFCLLDQPGEPTVEAQVEARQDILGAFPGKKAVVRTLSTRADKPLPFLTDVTEASPVPSVRAYRTTHHDPGVLNHQLEALTETEATTEAKVWVMTPMISTAEEAGALTQKARSYGLKTARMMIEMPSTVLMTNKLLKHADFASVGANGLTQYVMAADHLLPSLADLSTAWRPTVLHLIGIACEGASPKGRPVDVCGEAAANPVLAAMLVGLGVASLSMAACALFDVNAVLKSITLAECQELVRIALDMATAEDVRSTVYVKLPILEELGL